MWWNDFYGNQTENYLKPFFWKKNYKLIVNIFFNMSKTQLISIVTYIKYLKLNKTN